MTTDPEDCVDDGQDAYADIEIDASTELVGEHGRYARDPHGVKLTTTGKIQVTSGWERWQPPQVVF